MIVVVSHDLDDHAAAVLRGLDAADAAAILVDSGEFPVQSRLTQHFIDGATVTSMKTARGTIDFADVGAIWWRRPRPYGLDPTIDSESASFVVSEAHEAITGMWHCTGASWVNPPVSDEVAHHKPYQLSVAGAVGLSLPETLITNDPDEARTFITARGPEQTVFKTFLATETHWRETRILTSEEMELLDQVALAPVIFQDRVQAVADLRITIVGEDMFVTEITKLPGGYALDYRVDMGRAIFTPSTLPDGVATALRRLMSELGLVYGAIDLLRTADGGYVFLEVNPAGEWLFIEERSGQPITAAMVSLLARLDKEGGR